MCPRVVTITARGAAAGWGSSPAERGEHRERLHVGGDVVGPDQRRSTLRRQEVDGERAGVAIGRQRRAGNRPMKPLRDAPTTTGWATSRGSARSNATLCSMDLPKPMPGVDDHRRHTTGEGAGGAVAKRRGDLGDDVVVRRMVLHRLRRAEHVHRSGAARRGRRRRPHVGIGSPLMSLTMWAPPASAAAATSAHRVSTLTSRPSATSAAITGRTRSISVATPAGAAPGRVDSPPTSTTRAPAAPAAVRARPPGRPRRSGRRR